MKIAVALVLLSLALGQASAQSAKKHFGKNDSAGSWIPIRVTTNRILVPVRVNGHPATANLINSITTRVDKDFIDNNHIPPLPGTSGQPGLVSLTVQIGDETISQPITATPYQHQNSSPSFDIMLGDELFKEFVVDIDFRHQRLALRDPDSYVPPKNAIMLAFKQNGDSRAVPASIEHGPTMFYWIYMGDPAPISVYQNYFRAHGMLQERVNSIRMGGGKRTPPEAIATIRQVSLAGTTFNEVPGVFPDDSVAGDHPAEVAGHIGLAILSRYRVIFDYRHDRLYVNPGPGSVTAAPFAKDRSGLVIQKIKDDYVVRFVSPGSPAMKAGFRGGDTVIQVDNQPMPAFLGTAWQTPAWGSVHPTAVGTTYTFTLKDSTVRKLSTAEYF